MSKSIEFTIYDGFPSATDKQYVSFDMISIGNSKSVSANITMLMAYNLFELHENPRIDNHHESFRVFASQARELYTFYLGDKYIKLGATFSIYEYHVINPTNITIETNIDRLSYFNGFIKCIGELVKRDMLPAINVTKKSKLIEDKQPKTLTITNYVQAAILQLINTIPRDFIPDNKLDPLIQKFKYTNTTKLFKIANDSVLITNVLENNFFSVRITIINNDGGIQCIGMVTYDDYVLLKRIENTDTSLVFKPCGGVARKCKLCKHTPKVKVEIIDQYHTTNKKMMDELFLHLNELDLDDIDDPYKDAFNAMLQRAFYKHEDCVINPFIVYDGKC